ncbi:MAG: hypothetical protein IT378_03590 [Sandaracinaceae bacterium]|nr:hypothetical protein [Sandaracinaceae bacterium]
MSGSGTHGKSAEGQDGAPGARPVLDRQRVGNLASILRMYRLGFYPYFERRTERFYWDIQGSRSFIPVTVQTLAKAKRLARSVKQDLRFAFSEHTTAVLQLLSDDAIKPETWVRGPVLDVYEALLAEKRLVTFEILRKGEIVGATLCVRNEPVLHAETMFSSVDGASKLALVHTVEYALSQDLHTIDVQVAHPKGHPVSRLGEVTCGLDDYLERFRTVD